MENIDTLHYSRPRYDSRERVSTKSNPKSSPETKIRKLEGMCEKLKQHPRLEAGISSEELIEILMAERRRLKASQSAE